MYAHLIRTESNATFTTGTMSFYTDSRSPMFSVRTLERPWLNNMRKISCIPNGLYLVTKRYSLRHGHHFLIQNVKNRDSILIHRGNYVHQSEGCILVGMGLQNYNGFKNSATLASRQAIEKMDLDLPEAFNLFIE